MEAGDRMEIRDMAEVRDGISARDMIGQAYRARERAYTPYSHFQVGAALRSKAGNLYLGCNIENASYGVTNCAERTAFFKAVSEGEVEFDCIAIVGGPKAAGGEAAAGGPAEGGAGAAGGPAERHPGVMCAPCGVCRQVMMEFCDPDTFRIYLEDGEGGIKSYLLRELLPLGFGPDNLKKGEPES